MQVVFDICGTMYHSNTTLDFCEWRNKSIFYKLYFKILRSIAFRAINKILRICFKREVDTRAIFLKSLKNISKDMLNLEAEQFLAEYLKPRENALVINKLKSFNKDDIALVSATIEPVAMAIAKHFEIKKYYASTLLFSNNLCSGELESDLLGRKHLLFSQIDFLATDNLSDIRLCQISKECLIITKKRHKAFWLKQNLLNSAIVEI